ncbi:MAG: imidazolonepropionase, partial [Bacteroidales bacterium]|nr:imidazolonepropionase [Bacteroidales bacterium]
MKYLIKNIAHLYGILPVGTERLQGKEMSHVETIHDAWIAVSDGCITDFGPKSTLPDNDMFDTVIDAEGGSLMPCFCDPHTHLVYAGSREQEFVDKIQGLSYAEIARRGGGILNSVELLHRLTEQELYEQAMRRMEEIEAKGTGCIEIKSGYGLSTEDELKILR